jgi:hypothetical protein
MKITKDDVADRTYEKKRRKLCDLLRSDRELTSTDRERIATELEEMYVYIPAYDEETLNPIPRRPR